MSAALKPAMSEEAAFKMGRRWGKSFMAGEISRGVTEAELAVVIVADAAAIEAAFARLDGYSEALLPPRVTE